MQGDKVVSAIALIVIGAVLFGLHQSGEFGETTRPVNLEIPFAGTPAEQWPLGEQGVVVPDGNPAYEQVRQAIIASRMDPATLTDHQPDRFLAMLAPAVRAHVTKELHGWTTLLKRGTKLLPNGIRVSGKMTLGEKDGYPAVTADHVFAYAFEPPDPAQLSSQLELVAAIREKVTYTITPEGLWLSDSDGFQYSIACEAAKEGFLAPQFTEPGKHGSRGDERKFFSTDGQPPTENTCD